MTVSQVLVEVCHNFPQECIMKRIVELIIKAAQTHATRCEQAGTIFSQRIETRSNSEPLNKIANKHRMARMANKAKTGKEREGGK